MDFESIRQRRGIRVPGRVASQRWAAQRRGDTGGGIVALWSTVFELAGWLPLALAAVLAALRFRNDFRGGVADAAAAAWLMFVGLVFAAGIAGAVVYQMLHGYFPLRDLASAAAMPAIALSVAFLLWVVVSSRLEARAVIVSTAGALLFAPIFWIGAVLAMYAMPRAATGF